MSGSIKNIILAVLAVLLTVIPISWLTSIYGAGVSAPNGAATALASMLGNGILLGYFVTVYLIKRRRPFGIYVRLWTHGALWYIFFNLVVLTSAANAAAWYTAVYLAGFYPVLYYFFGIVYFFENALRFRMGMPQARYRFFYPLFRRYMLTSKSVYCALYDFTDEETGGLGQLNIDYADAGFSERLKGVFYIRTEAVCDVSKLAAAGRRLLGGLGRRHARYIGFRSDAGKATLYTIYIQDPSKLEKFLNAGLKAAGAENIRHFRLETEDFTEDVLSHLLVPVREIDMAKPLDEKGIRAFCGILLQMHIYGGMHFSGIKKFVLELKLRGGYTPEEFAAIEAAFSEKGCKVYGSGDVFGGSPSSREDKREDTCAVFFVTSCNKFLSDAAAKFFTACNMYYNLENTMPGFLEIASGTVKNMLAAIDINGICELPFPVAEHFTPEDLRQRTPLVEKVLAAVGESAQKGFEVTSVYLGDNAVAACKTAAGINASKPALIENIRLYIVETEKMLFI